MRVCILTRHIPPAVTDGIARNRWLYAKLFKKFGWEVHVITSGVGGLEEYKDGIYIHEIEPDYGIKDNFINKITKDENLRHMLAYSYAAYKRVKQLNRLFPIDLIDQSLWGLEGLVTKIKLANLPMLTRIDTTSRLIYEINHPNKNNVFTSQHQLEQFMLLNSDAFVFNSWSILKETERLYELSLVGKPYTIIHHGIEKPHYEQVEKSSEQKKSFKVVIPGRLEKRKGTELMIKYVLPKLLLEYNDIEIHFVGKDNSDWDGFKEETGLTYTDYINKNFKKDIYKRLFVHGYVSEEDLVEHYETADCIMAPSLYESLGLVYLEAASQGKPLIALKCGAIVELFEHKKEVLLADVNHPEELSDFVGLLKIDPKLGAQLARNAMEKLQTNFSPEIMVSKCIAFVEDILYNENSGTIYQLMNSFTLGDGVSNFTRDYDFLLKQQGRVSQIMGNYASDALKHLSKQVHECDYKEDDIILYHYCGHCEWAEYLNNTNIPGKVLFFHNITPPHFFELNDPEHKSVITGIRQVPVLDNFDLYVALSQYSLNVLQQLIPKKLNTFIMPQLIDKQLILSKPYNATLATTLRKQHTFHIIFVGRVVPHKKQTDILRFFHYYKNHYKHPFHVSIIGGGKENSFTELHALVKKFQLQNEVTITRKISDDDLYAFYRAADVYLSMSEHEGFGTPLAEAMVFEVPVVAYGVTAIPETVGDNDCIFYEKDWESLSIIMHKLYSNKDFKANAIAKQNNQLKKYSKESVSLAIEQMLLKCYELHRERLNQLASEWKIFSEEFVNFKDPRFIKRGEWRAADGRTMIHYGHTKDHCVELIEDFIEADVFIVHNGHSGMAGIYLNNQEVAKVDLYNTQWVVRKYSIRAANPGINNIKIVPLCEKNDKSTGKEVLVYGVTLKRKYRPLVGAIYKDSQILSDK